MSRRIVNITLDNLGDLPPKCRKCVFWELGPVSRARAEESGDPELEKESWVSSVLLEWGSCGKIAYVDGVPAGYMLFAPPQYVPRSIAFPTSPVSADAVLFMTAHLLSEFAGGGIGRMLVQAMAKDLTRRGVRAIEAFGDRRWESPACMLPVDYLLAVGFKTVRPHHHYPRLRMELRTVLTWREDVEVALERLLGSMTPSTPQGALRPVLPVLRFALRGRELIRPTERSDVFGELAEQSGLRLGSDDLLDHLPAGEHVHGRNGHDAVTLRHGGILVDVELYHGDLVRVLGGDLLEDRGDHAARAAPFGPVIHDDRLVVLQDLHLEGLVRHDLGRAHYDHTPLTCDEYSCTARAVSAPCWLASVPRPGPPRSPCRPR
jgi:hypothetical protein